MALTRCAIFYATASKHLRFKILPDDDAELARLRAPPGISFFLAPTVATPRGQGCPDDAACRRLIAAQTGTAALAAAADRCCVVDAAKTVVAVIKADPTLDTIAGHTLVLDPLADIGDTYTGSAFLRRYVIANSTAGLVLSAVSAPPGAPPATAAGQFALASPSAAIGALVPLPKTLKAVLGGALG